MRGVLAVIGDATGRYKDDLVHGKLAPGSLLSLCFTRGSVQLVGPDTTATTAAFMDRLTAPVCSFAIDETGHKEFASVAGMRWKGQA